MKDQIRRDADADVKRLLDLMPEGHKERVKEVSERVFPEAIAEIKRAREQFEREVTVQQQALAMRRYVFLWKTLLRNVSIHLIGGTNYFSYGTAVQKNEGQHTSLFDR